MTDSKVPVVYRNKTILIDNDKNTKLHYAAAFDDEKTLEKELANGQNINAKNFFGWTPLMVAVRNGSLASIKFLLSKGANSTENNYYGMNLLLIAICGGSLEVVTIVLNYLLSGGVSRRILQRSVSPVSLAILFCNSEVFQYLMQKHFELDIPTPITGVTPLMFAAAVNNTKAFKKLLSKNANPQLRNALNLTAQNIVDIKIARATPKPAPNLAHSVPQIFIVSPRNNVQNQFLQLPRLNQVRRSSDFGMKPVICTPGISPIIPQSPCIPVSNGQYFFPPNFSPSQFSPVIAYSNADFLNMPINHVSPSMDSPIFYTHNV